ncbi:MULTISPECIES: hypothetical protein [Brenneria]|uniref:Uncharacterized protein n=1 Tax=Brenneria nigrifluens DSM 30175 = ATCC 13028 TaxID=1121120 RepID=A0A2U1UTZ2_9GAMM|nr:MULTISPECIES: hypothetical protein [Brenneria]EHD21770.1 hypothetical protein BrE312_2390 [Brenneria sp. EniD312]PWC25123.1 hypothetical protein DDT54_04270 [Brenneria nigrifluens DSM 30175 = ATCC 13028]QCR04880.1 hypothetical protein EH206_12235 [Brenneria nigrifluens DSM 30175 = ATCC 13028]
MKIDLILCGEILTKLGEYYPTPARSEQLSEIEKIAGDDEDILVANLVYLEQHRLLVSGIKRGLNGHVIYTGGLVLTKDGIDYIREDGGLTALRDKASANYQLHEAILSELIRQIQASPDTDRDKEALASQLRSLPAETIKHLYMKLLDQGVSYLPGVFQLIQKLLRPE